MEAVATHLKIFMGLALVHFQKYWLLKSVPVAVWNHASLPIENVNKRKKLNSLTCIELNAQSHVRMCQSGMQGDHFTLAISNPQN